MRHFDQSLQAVASLPLALAEKFDIVNIGRRVRRSATACTSATTSEQASTTRSTTRWSTTSNDLIATGDYPQLSALVSEYGLEGTWAELARYFADPQRFERGLERVLDGVATALDLPPAT